MLRYTKGIKPIAQDITEELKTSLLIRSGIGAEFSI
jgi:hypothetical protein